MVALDAAQFSEDRRVRLLADEMAGQVGTRRNSTPLNRSETSLTMASPGLQAVPCPECRAGPRAA